MVESGAEFIPNQSSKSGRSLMCNRQGVCEENTLCVPDIVKLCLRYTTARDPRLREQSISSIRE